MVDSSLRMNLASTCKLLAFRLPSACLEREFEVQGKGRMWEDIICPVVMRPGRKEAGSLPSVTQGYVSPDSAEAGCGPPCPTGHCICFFGRIEWGSPPKVLFFFFDGNLVELDLWAPLWLFVACNVGAFQKLRYGEEKWCRRTWQKNFCNRKALSF